MLPPALSENIDEPEEPWDLAIDPPQRRRDGTIEVTYRFQLSDFECETLIAAVSSLYARLTFVLGCVAPAGDEQSSLLMNNGRVWRWKLPNRRKEALFRKVPKETEDNEDEVTWALAEMDWAMMDEVVDHWKAKVSQLMAGIKRASRTEKMGKKRPLSRTRHRAR